MNLKLCYDLLIDGLASPEFVLRFKCLDNLNTPLMRFRELGD